MNEDALSINEDSRSINGDTLRANEDARRVNGDSQRVNRDARSVNEDAPRVNGNSPRVNEDALRDKTLDCVNSKKQYLKNKSLPREALDSKKGRTKWSALFLVFWRIVVSSRHK